MPLVFLKHLSERYDIVHYELKELVKDPKSDYYTADKAEIDFVLEDRDEYRSRNILKIPKPASWQYLKDNAEQDDIKVKIDDAFDVIQDLLTEHNPQLNNILPRIFVRSELSPKQTGGIINLLSHPKFSEKENPESDILGRIYEYYIGRFAMAEGSGAGQFFTPGSIVRLLVEIIEPFKGRIFDPACGSGGMFVQSLKFISEHGGKKSYISIYGQEMTAQTLRLCLMNLMLRDLSFDIKLGNSLLDDKFPKLKADYVIAKPPFNVSNWHPEDLPDGDPRLFILSKNRDGKDGIHREHNNEILFIDTSKIGTMISRKLRVFTDADVSRIAETYHKWRSYSPPTELVPVFREVVGGF